MARGRKAQPKVSLAACTQAVGDYLSSRYGPAALARRLECSEPTAAKALKGRIQFDTYVRLVEIEGEAFVRAVVEPILGAAAAVPILSRLAGIEGKLEQIASTLNLDDPTSEAPKVVELALDRAPQASPVRAWLARWSTAPLDAKTAVRMAGEDPTGRAGVVKRDHRALGYVCLAVGSTVRHLNANGTHLVGSSTRHWAANPYLASCLEAYDLAAERMKPVLQQVTLAPGRRDLGPMSRNYLRLLLPYRDRRQNVVVIVVTDPLDASYGRSSPFDTAKSGAGRT